MKMAAVAVIVLAIGKGAGAIPDPQDQAQSPISIDKQGFVVGGKRVEDSRLREMRLPGGARVVVCRDRLEILEGFVTLTLPSGVTATLPAGLVLTLQIEGERIDFRITTRDEQVTGVVIAGRTYDFTSRMMLRLSATFVANRVVTQLMVGIAPREEAAAPPVEMIETPDTHVSIELERLTGDTRQGEGQPDLPPPPGIIEPPIENPGDISPVLPG
ncbi:MAG: hypothetical protein HYY16_18475 [Planctomycetes bacterium]|nr:hypothetical protein [Planctomycetota bacterium]